MASAPVSSAPRTPIVLRPPLSRHRSGPPPDRCRLPTAVPDASIRARCVASAGQISIAPAEPGAPLPAPSFPGGFRTPALDARGHLRDGPASETRHKGGSGINSLGTSLVPPDSCRSYCAAEVFSPVPSCSGWPRARPWSVQPCSLPFRGPSLPVDLIVLSEVPAGGTSREPAACQVSDGTVVPTRTAVGEGFSRGRRVEEKCADEFYKLPNS